MSERPTRKVAVVLERTAVSSRWATHQWQAAGVIPDVGGEPRVLLEREGELRKVFPGYEVALYRDEAEGYYLNMSSDAPCAFVSVRTDEEGGDPVPFQVTVSYNEAARWMDAGASGAAHIWRRNVQWDLVWKLAPAGIVGGVVGALTLS